MCEGVCDRFPSMIVVPVDPRCTGGLVKGRDEMDILVVVASIFSRYATEETRSR
jgi:hypothetical protein